MCTLACGLINTKLCSGLAFRALCLSFLPDDESAVVINSPRARSKSPPPPQVAGVAVVLHVLVGALLHCPPLLSLACSLSSRGVFSSSSDAGLGGDGPGVCTLEEGVCTLEEDFVGEPGRCMEVDW